MGFETIINISLSICHLQRFHNAVETVLDCPLSTDMGRGCKFEVSARMPLLHLPSCKWIVFLFLGCEKRPSSDSSD